MYIDNIFFQLSMSGTIVGICTAVLFAHDGSTAGDHPVGWVVIPSTAVHVVGCWEHVVLILGALWAPSTSLSLIVGSRRNSTVCGHFLLYGIQDTQMHDLKMKQGLMFLVCFSYEYCKVAEAGTLEWGSE